MAAGTAFTLGRAKSALLSVCQSRNIDFADAVLARFGENATFTIEGHSLVVRVGRSTLAAEKEANVARWLEANRFPAARLAKGFDRPIVAADLPVTLWEYLPPGDEPISSREFGTVLRELHELPAPTDFQLPAFEPLPKVPGRLENIRPGYLSADEFGFLAARTAELNEKFARLDFPLPSGPVHGDAHPGNLHRTSDGSIHLIDFEDFAIGPREWDAAVLSVRHQAFGWETDEDYRQYVDAYGFDASTWPGFPVLRAARELNMTTWLAQKLGESPQVDAEIHRRIADLCDDQFPRTWQVF
jgi:hypothetical protein